MTTADAPLNRSIRTRIAIICLWVALPLFGLGYQLASKFTAQDLPQGTHLGFLYASALSDPWFWAALFCEIAGLIAWLLVLSEYSLAKAFSISAISYVLVVGAGCVLFGETLSLLQITGGVAIVVGVWLIGGVDGESD